MTDYHVTNELELGNATWISQERDSIIFESGDYGVVSVKNGVNYEFCNGSTAARLLGLGVDFDGGWSAGSIQLGSCQITNPNINPENISCYYVFLKTLTINSRFPENTSFVHANGVHITLRGNDNDGFTMNGSTSLQSQLPRAVAQIMVPVLENFDLELCGENSWVIGNDSSNYAEQKILAEPHINMRRTAEMLEEHTLIGLPISDMAYKAQWALNDFLREYARLTNNKNIQNLSISEFHDGIQFALAPSDLSKFVNPQCIGHIEHFSNAPLREEDAYTLQAAILSSESHSFQEFTEYHLHRFDYHFAVTGMYQEFETAWKNCNAHSSNKWAYIEFITQNDAIKNNLAELINARNHIQHSGCLKTLDMPINKLKWDGSKLTQYEIYSLKKPWEWNTALRQFLSP